ncbi:MAG: LPS export ABC transporter periplasmic protein LptC, partial [Candidatus Aminicenantales bacterium]
MRTNPASMIKGAVIAFLMAVLILIGWNFITQSRKKPKIPEESEEIETQKVEKKEKIEHFEVKGVRGDFRVKADKHYRGDDSKYHLEGNVEVIFFRRREGKDIFIHADEIIYDEGWNHFLIPAEGHIRSEDILVEAAALEYDDEREVFVSNDGVRFSSKAISGSADRMAYSLKEERIDLQDNVFLTIRPLLGTSFPLQLKGRRFAYSRIKRKGTMEGEVLITHGRSQAWADYCGFELFADEEQVKSLHLKGTVRATLIDELSDISGEGTSFVLYGKKQEIIADEIRLRGFIDLPKVHALEATGHCSFKFYSSEGEMTLIEGDFVEFVLSREGQL